MPQKEFELYLKLLANLLDLQPSQREEIRDEMRDHLEERLAELSELGVSREEAVERALDEFGDAAGLAGSFTQLANERTHRRRVLVYRTTASAVAVTLVLLAAFAFWPAADAVVAPPVAVAQQPDAAAPVAPVAAEPPRVHAAQPSPARAKVEAALRKPVRIDFVETPFEEAVEFVSELVEIDVLIDKQAFGDVDLELDTPVTIGFRHAQPPARAVLQLMVDELGAEDELAVVVGEGFVRITRIDLDSLDVEVYDVRDLLETRRPAPRPEDPFGGAGGGFGGAAHARAPVSNEGIGGLLDVVATTVSPSSWNTNGGHGTIAAFDGMLVVGNSPEVHRRVQALLTQLRSVRAAQPESPARPR